MARILLGVSGGIAAYKALELARLATKAGHGVRVLMTPDRRALRRRGLVRGHRRRAGAHRRVRARPDARRLPRRRAAGARPDRPPGAGRQRRRLPRRAGLGQHAREARGRDLRLDAHHLLPGLHGAARGRPGDERPHVRRRGDAGEPGDAARARRAGDRARRPARSPRAASTASAACPSPSGCWPRSRRCCPPPGGSWDGLRVLVTAGGTREPIDPVRFIGNRSSGRMGLALAEAAARRGAEVTLIAANVSAAAARRRSRRCAVETTAELAARRRRARSRTATCC